ncbi:hypothetical protein ACQKN7_30535 [Bacillus cereus]|uniref:hypothetical protein n=1 Tax=Bacillus cereus group TaxID=86661 RepID=UPI001BCC7E7D|nr:hypothetical protein [Bacillus toyonensis]
MKESIMLSQYIEEQTGNTWVTIANETGKALAGTMAYDEIEYELSKQYQRFAEDYEQHKLISP